MAVTKPALTVQIKKGINPKDYFPDSKHIIIYAFTLGDYHYFRFDDALNTPYERALQCLVYYRELGMNCDHALLTAHTQAFDALFSQPKFSTKDLVKMVELNEQLKQRLHLPKEPELMYKLASVVFFDHKENPLTYEFNYGINKIKYWKRNTSLTDFFLQRPMVELIPYLKHAGKNLEQFSQMIQEQTAQHSDKLLPLLSDVQRTIFSSK